MFMRKVVGLFWCAHAQLMLAQRILWQMNEFLKYLIVEFIVCTRRVCVPHGIQK